MDILNPPKSCRKLADKLNERELTFANLLLTREQHGMSPGECYMRSGYNVRDVGVATVCASKLSKRKAVWEYMRRMRGESMDTVGLTIEYLDEQLRQIIDGTAPDVVSSFMTTSQTIDEKTGLPVVTHTPILRCAIDDLPEEVRAAIQSIKMTKHGPEVKFYNRVDALKLALQRHGALTEKREHSGPGGGPIETTTRIERVIVDSPTDSDGESIPAASTTE